jgi:prevent-host-death family protein
MATRKERAIMNIVGVKELKNRLTQYLRRAKLGEEVIVTERGRPIAVIRSAEEALPDTSLEARLSKLAGEGRVQLPRRKFLVRIPRITVEGLSMAQTVIEDRR